MSLVLSFGSNLNQREDYLDQAFRLTQEKFNFIAKSKVYESSAVDYLNQPDFLNFLAEYKIPDYSQEKTLNVINNIENQLGRLRLINKGPRTIDIDIIFWGTTVYRSKSLTIPHESWDKRSFIVEPLKELPYFQSIQKSFKIPIDFKNKCWPYKK